MDEETQAQPGLTLFEPRYDTRFQVRRIGSDDAGQELAHIAFDESYRGVAEKKFHHWVIKAHDLSAPAANILKQTCLTLGTDAGVHRGAINCTIDREAVLISATQAQLERLIQKLRPQPFGLKALSESLVRMLQRQKQLSQGPLQVMAILNVTPDSFSDGGRLTSTEALIAQAGQALEAGAHILDIGGESTRPGAALVPQEEEMRRVAPAVEALHRAFPEAVISVDTRKATVAQAALAAGASMINDVSGLTFDPAMLGVVAEAHCPVVIMHSRGTPDVMQQNLVYSDLVGEISAFFYQQVALAVAAGVSPQHIILDPGFGFGKTLEHNLELMRRLPELASIGFPLLVGTSRKQFLTLGQLEAIPPDEREALTAASLALAIQSGARLVRLHDVVTQMPVVRWASRVWDRA